MSFQTSVSHFRYNSLVNSKHFYLIIQGQIQTIRNLIWIRKAKEGVFEISDIIEHGKNQHQHAYQILEQELSKEVAFGEIYKEYIHT
jgi:hypothetical protein